ncbi:hypothetical protein KRR26_07045 [Corallococcus sp. M34]|uniref:hypothetical protein n=1 Tax=Citreicoccus inhibens TaxID=2849499 RepID=UPI0011C3AF8D|nr:hypothetical protein [Citreicoccus inhibens]MBU8895354.1 hypothetical protein [Citreicoccus inhibens]
MNIHRHAARCLVLSAMSWALAFASGCGVASPSESTAPETEYTQDDSEVSAQAQELAGCKFYNYYHDEGTNPGGANRCSNACQCDGMRTCSSFGWCQGTARPPVSCTSPQYYWNEAWNPQGSNRCSSNCDCDGRRTCSSAGWCQGTAR